MIPTKYPKFSRKESEAQILRMIPLYITKHFSPNATQQYNNYIIEEEFDELELIIDDFSDEDWEDNCQIVSSISEALHWNKKQKYRFWQYMRDFLGIQSLPSNTSAHTIGHTSNAMFAIDENKNENVSETRTSIRPMKVDWKLGPNETRLLSQARMQLNRQCFNQLQDHDIQSLVNIYAIGIKNNINSLIVLLYDIYTRYRIQIKLSEFSNDRGYIGPTVDHMQFVRNSKFLQNHMKHMDCAYNDIIECLSNFEARFLPRLYVGRNKVIDDDCNHFIDYSLMVGQILNEILYVSSSSSVPMEVNLVLIPKNVKSGFIDLIDDEEESSDDEDGSMLKMFDDENKDDSRVKSDAQTFGKLLETRNISYISSNVCVDNLSDFKLSKQRLKKMFMQYLLTIGGKSHQRVNVVVDRRQSNNEVYIYQLPEKMYNCIPDGYSIENLIFSCAHYVLPNVDYVERSGGSGGWSDTKYVGGKHDSDEMFLLSFECLGKHLNRLHFFWTGGGMRLEPKLLAKIWSNCFSNMVVDRKYTEEYLVQNFGLDCVDRNFEEWYEIFCGK